MRMVPLTERTCTGTVGLGAYRVLGRAPVEEPPREWDPRRVLRWVRPYWLGTDQTDTVVPVVEVQPLGRLWVGDQPRRVSDLMGQ